MVEGAIPRCTPQSRESSAAVCALRPWAHGAHAPMTPIAPMRPCSPSYAEPHGADAPGVEVKRGRGYGGDGRARCRHTRAVAFGLPTNSGRSRTVRRLPTGVKASVSADGRGPRDAIRTQRTRLWGGVVGGVDASGSVKL